MVRNRFSKLLVFPTDIRIQGFIYYIIRSPILDVHTKCYLKAVFFSTLFYAEGQFSGLPGVYYVMVSVTILQPVVASLRVFDSSKNQDVLDISIIFSYRSITGSYYTLSESTRTEFQAYDGMEFM